MSYLFLSCTEINFTTIQIRGLIGNEIKSLYSRLPKNIQTAFALTIHKSQGSEFTHTAVVLEQAATRLLSQELIYTAITRAKSVVSLLVDQDAFGQALTVKTTRQSGLRHKIDNLI